MDPIIVSSSLIVLLGETRGVVDDLTREFRHAPAEIASLTSSLQSLMGVLDSVAHDNIRARADNGCKHLPSFQPLNFIAA